MAKGIAKPMPSRETQDYYDATANRDVRVDLTEAIELVTKKNIAIDCGCGAGRDIEHLRQQGFEVYGFDLESEAVDRCNRRFARDEKVHVTEASFSSFEYCPANLIVADASLFYCPPEEFVEVWHKIVSALLPGGVFVGSFLGFRDSMVVGPVQGEVDWPIVSSFDERSLRSNFDQLNIVKWTEHEMDGKKVNGDDNHWHIYAVIAEKK
ncbi:MAG: SAM-dependent methyltransferase [Planctomycetaceae bacterium]